MLLLWVSAHCVSSPSSTVHGHLLVRCSWRRGLNSGFGNLCTVREEWRSLKNTALEIEESLSGAVHSHAHVFVGDVVESLNTLDGRDQGSGSLWSWSACLVQTCVSRISCSCPVAV